MLTKEQTIIGLSYIAHSPDEKHGGFNEQTILIAKSALKLITEKQEEK